MNGDYTPGVCDAIREVILGRPMVWSGVQQLLFKEAAPDEAREAVRVLYEGMTNPKSLEAETTLLRLWNQHCAARTYEEHRT